MGQSGNFRYRTARLTIDSDISDGGNGFGITKTGGGTATFSAINTYSGVTAVNSGILRAFSDTCTNNISSSSTISVGGRRYSWMLLF